MAKSQGGWVVESKSTNDAPKGDCFHVLVQYAAVYGGRHSTQLRISMQVGHQSHLDSGTALGLTRCSGFQIN